MACICHFVFFSCVCVLPRSSYGHIWCGFIPSVVLRFSKLFFQLFRCRNLALNTDVFPTLEAGTGVSQHRGICTPPYICMPPYICTTPCTSVCPSPPICPLHTPCNLYVPPIPYVPHVLRGLGGIYKLHISWGLLGGNSTSVWHSCVCWYTHLLLHS